MIRRRLPSLTSLRNFESVARLRSFTNAADELCVTQGAVSHQIKLIEEELGTKLLVRSPHGIELTDAGSRLLEVASQAFNEFSSIVQDIRFRAAQTRPRLMLNVSPQFSQFWLASRIGKFAVDYPDVELCVSHGNKEGSYQEEDYSLEILPLDRQASTQTGEELFTADLLPLCSPMLINQSLRNIGSEEFRDSVLLCETGHDWWTDWNTTVGDDHALLNNHRIFFDDPAMAVHVAVSGKGLMMGSPKLLRKYIEDGVLVAPIDSSLCVSRTYQLRYSNKAIGNNHVVAFRNWLLDEVKSDMTLMH